MKKHFFYYIAVCLTTLFTWGCTTNDIDDVFEENASQRLDDMTQECMDLLTGASNGWLIEYYPEDNQSYGGYVYLASFDRDGNVTVAGEIGEPDERVTSHFSILSSNSVVLSFDTYNSLFHYFADPDVLSGNSYEGDFEFAFKGGNSNELTFTGTKTGNTIMFKAMDADADWTSYLTQVAEMESTIRRSPYCSYVYNGADGTITFNMDTSYHLLTYVPDSSEPDVTATVAYCYTADGITLYTPVTLGLSQAQTFRWDDAAGQMVCEENSGVVLNGGVSDNYVPYDTFLGDWYLTYYYGTVPVSIVAQEEGVSFTLTGLTFDLTLNYDKSTGQLSLTTQYVGRYGNYYVFLCPWDADLGYLTWGDGYGFNIVYNGDEVNPVLSFENNGAWVGYDITSFLFCTFSSATASSSTRVGTLAQYPYLESLHK